jgi:hypothetical protein
MNEKRGLQLAAFFIPSRSRFEWVRGGQVKYPHDKFLINLPLHRHVDRVLRLDSKLERTTIPNPSRLDLVHVLVYNEFRGAK